MKNLKNSSKFKNSQKGLLVASLLAFLFGVTQSGFAQNKPDQTFKGVVGKTLAESKEYWPDPVKAPKNAPNVVWIVLDDVGYGASSAFGNI